MEKNNSFQALAGSVFQAIPKPGHAARPLKLDIKGDHSLQGVSQS